LRISVIEKDRKVLFTLNGTNVAVGNLNFIGIPFRIGLLMFHTDTEVEIVDFKQAIMANYPTTN